jgi:hypothetical protein
MIFWLEFAAPTTTARVDVELSDWEYKPIMWERLKQALMERRIMLPKRDGFSFVIGYTFSDMLLWW